MKKLFFKTSVIISMITMMVTFFSITAVAEQKPLKWRLANWGTRYPVNEELHHAFCESIGRASGGRLVVEDIYDGEGVSGFEVFSSVRSGLVEMGVPAMAYHVGEMPVGNIEWGLPGMTYTLDELRALYHEYSRG